MSIVEPAPAQDQFTLVVGDWQVGPEQEIGQFESAALTLSIDTGCEVQFTIPGRSPTARVIDELATDVWVLRNNVGVQRFRIVAVEQTWTPDGDDIVAVSAVCYKRLLNARHLMTPLDFAGVDQTQIVWGLYQHTQAQPGGDWGVTPGLLEPGTPRDRSYVIGENIGQIAANLSGVIGGPFFAVDYNLELQAFRYSEFPTNPIPLQWGATVRGMTRQSGASEFANSAFVDGDDSAVVPVIYDSPTITTDPRGRWERAAGFPNVVLQNTLVEKAQGIVEESFTPPATWSIELEPLRYLLDAPYSPGDFCDLLLPPSTVAGIGPAPFSQPVQIVSLNLTIDANGGTTATCEAIETGPPSPVVVGVSP